MIIGAMKSGTTELATRLAGHSRVCFCRVKEPHFFSTNSDWMENIDSYHKLYRNKPQQICGEASTSYSFPHEYPDIPARLHAYNPKLKFVYIVRNPVDRIKSHYAHRLMQGTASKDPYVEMQVRRDEYLNRSQYGLTLRNYFDHFSQEQMMILKFENYIENPELTTETVYEFLELPSEKVRAVTARNRSIGSNRSRFSPVYYVDQILSHSPSSVRRVLSRYISVKLPEIPQFPLDLEVQLRKELASDVSIFGDLSGIDISDWQAGYN